MASKISAMGMPSKPSGMGKFGISEYARAWVDSDPPQPPREATSPQQRFRSCGSTLRSKEEPFEGLHQEDLSMAAHAAAPGELLQVRHPQRCSSCWNVKNPVTERAEVGRSVAETLETNHQRHLVSASIANLLHALCL